MAGYPPSYQEVAPPAPPAILRPLDTQVGLSYRLQNRKTSLSGATVGGVGDDLFDLAGRARLGDWLVGASFWRIKTPIQVAGLSGTRNPALSPETTELRVRAGRVFLGGQGLFGLPLDVEAGLGLAFSSFQSDPNSTGIPFTGTPLDFSHYRRGLGLELPWAVAFGSVGLEGRLGYFPAMGGRLDKAPYAFQGNSLNYLEAAAEARIRLFAGLDLAIGTSLANWATKIDLVGLPGQDFTDLAATAVIGLVYRPERVGR